MYESISTSDKFVNDKGSTRVIYGETTDVVTTHTHDVSFGISEQAAALTDVAIYVDDGSGYSEVTSTIETALGDTLSATQEIDIDMTEFFTADGGIKKIKIVPTDAEDGKCRITGLLSVQFYMESR
jgi:hypothetical protein